MNRTIPSRIKASIWGMGMMLLLASCTSVDAPPEREPHAPLMVVRSGPYALLSWQSRMNQFYTILYADGPRQRADWRPLPDAQRIQGTGGEIRVQDRLPPAMPRHYRLMITQ